MSNYSKLDLRNARRHLSAAVIDKTGLNDADMMQLAINNGFQLGAAPVQAATPTTQTIPPVLIDTSNGPMLFDEIDAVPVAPAAPSDTDKALAALIATLTPSAPAFDEVQLKELIQKYSNPITTVQVTRVNAPTVKIKGAHKELARIVKRLAARKKVYLFGPAGSGKTTIAKQAAAALSIDFYHTGALLQKYELTGYTTANGDYISSTFFEAFKFGGLYLFDEVDASNPQAVIAFNMAIENLEMTFPNEVVKAHDDFRVIAAANTNGLGATVNYKRNSLDGAFLDRFNRIELAYDEKMERRLALAEFAACGGTDTAVCEEWVNTVQGCRAAALTAKIDVIISPRSSINGASVLGMGDTTEMAISETFGASLSADQRRQLGV